MYVCGHKKKRFKLSCTHILTWNCDDPVAMMGWNVLSHLAEIHYNTILQLRIPKMHVEPVCFKNITTKTNNNPLCQKARVAKSYGRTSTESTTQHQEKNKFMLCFANACFDEIWKPQKSVFFLPSPFTSSCFVWETASCDCMTVCSFTCTTTGLSLLYLFAGLLWELSGHCLHGAICTKSDTQLRPCEQVNTHAHTSSVFCYLMFGQYNASLVLSGAFKGWVAVIYLLWYLNYPVPLYTLSLDSLDTCIHY